MSDLKHFQVVQIVTHIMNKHGCEVHKIDWENRMVDFDGPSESQFECAKELEAFLG